MRDIIGLVLLAAAASAALWGIWRVKRAISTALSSARAVKRVLEQQADMLEETPKSVSGMTKVFLPQIERDFPEFHWEEFRQKTENMLKAVLRAVDAQDASYLADASGDLRRQVELKLEDLRSAGQREHFKNITVHRTEIAHYRKEGGLCAIVVQSAVGYLHYTEDEKGELVSGNRERKVQTKYNTELVYIQDVSKLADGATAVGVTCPNCGAPVTRLGSKFCEYCGAGLREVSVRVWSLNKIQELS